MPAGITCW